MVFFGISIDRLIITGKPVCNLRSPMRAHPLRRERPVSVTDFHRPRWLTDLTWALDGSLDYSPRFADRHFSTLI